MAVWWQKQREAQSFRVFSSAVDYHSGGWLTDLLINGRNLARGQWIISFRPCTKRYTAVMQRRSLLSRAGVMRQAASGDTGDTWNNPLVWHIVPTPTGTLVSWLTVDLGWPICVCWQDSRTPIQAFLYAACWAPLIEHSPRICYWWAVRECSVSTPQLQQADISSARWTQWPLDFSQRSEWYFWLITVDELANK